MTPGPLDAFVPPPASGTRGCVLAELGAALVALRPGARVAVALDGVDGAGKTVLGHELAEIVGEHREVHRVSVDGFHRPATERYAGGRTPETFYRDSYDHAAVRQLLVGAFLTGRPWVRAVHDVEREESLDLPPEPAAGPAAVLLVDGIFLHRPELADLWHASVFVDVPFAVSVPRGNARFGAVDAEAVDPESGVNARYVGGQRRYLGEVDPAARATWVLDNTDLARPVLTGRGRPAPRGGRAGERPTASG